MIRARTAVGVVAAAAIAVYVAWVARSLFEEEERRPRSVNGTSESSRAASPPERQDGPSAARSGPLAAANVTSSASVASESSAPAPAAGPSARFIRLSAAVDAAIATRNGHRCRLLMYDVADLGREGWPLIARIANATFDAPGDETGAETSRVRGELIDLFDSGRLSGLAVEAVLSPDSNGGTVRQLATSSRHPFEKATPEELAKIREGLASESDPDVVSSLVSGLRSRKAIDLAALVRLLGASPHRAARVALVEAIGEEADPERLEALKKLRDTARDREVLTAARILLLEAEPPVEGFLVKRVKLEAATASLLEPGDIVTLCDGHKVRGWYDLGEGDEHVFTVWRDGVSLDLRARAPYPKLDGRHVWLPTPAKTTEQPEAPDVPDMPEPAPQTGE